MKTFNKPTNLNGAELQKELLDSGIVVDKIFDNGNGTISFETDNEELTSKLRNENKKLNEAL